MGITTARFVRKPIYVDAVRLTAANFDEIAAWCQGEVMQDEVTGNSYIKVRVHHPKIPRQTQAFVGDWLLYTERGYKVYTAKAFYAQFDLVQKTKSGEKQPIKASSENETRRLEEEGYVTPAVVRARAARSEDVAEAMLSDPEAKVALGVSGEVDRQLVEKFTNEVGPPPIPGAQRNLLNGDVIGQPTTVEDVPEQEKIEPAAAEGKRVLSIAEQEELHPDTVQEMIRAGEVVLAQDIAQP